MLVEVMFDLLIIIFCLVLFEMVKVMYDVCFKYVCGFIM